MKATFAAGCFWHVEHLLGHTPGVTSTKVGYTGGTVPSPTYRDVCGDTTGHAEAVQVEFDPDRIAYEDLLKIFWKNHDPTTPNRQGPDIGSQYRSAVFCHDDSQMEAARRSRAEVAEKYDRPIVTEIRAAEPFYEAEEYHQKYIEKRYNL
ncbi:MAG: peptide-methionine (S)-S-oxide reductase MsrA [Nitrosopumilaceae archaeon]|nr:peptide-methionine (S)-S-oxide reductase MsrA [Nitrosopumilaceae archaeon]